MNSPEHADHHPESPKTPDFINELKGLLTRLEFEESEALLEARIALLAALNQEDQNKNLLRAVSIEYAKVCEQIVDESESDISDRAQLQIGMIVYKALVFFEANDLSRCIEELGEAEEYASSVHLHQVASAIQDILERLFS
jgi:hypothetical protein